MVKMNCLLLWLSVLWLSVLYVHSYSLLATQIFLKKSNPSPIKKKKKVVMFPCTHVNLKRKLTVLD